jgi:hypothetical protein
MERRLYKKLGILGKKEIKNNMRDKPMQVALIRPDTNIKTFKIFSESLALGYLSAFLRENFIETDIIDAYLEGMKLEDLVHKVLKKSYKVVGFTVYNAASLEWTAKAAKLIKEEKSEIHIIIGGHTPSFDYEYILQSVPEIDSVARFEGEYILLDLSRAILNREDWTTTRGLAYSNGNRIISNEPSSFFPQLDQLPFPQRDYLPYLIKNCVERKSSGRNRKSRQHLSCRLLHIYRRCL